MCTTASKAGSGSLTPLFKNKNGVRIYNDSEDALREFGKLSLNFIHISKSAFVSKDDWNLPKEVKKTNLGEFLKDNDINDSIVVLDKGHEKRELKRLSDYGFEVKAEPIYNESAVNPWDETRYYVSKKKMTRMNLDFSTGTYYKRGVKG